MSRVTALPGLQAAGYVRHALHAEGCTWLEKNCYVDIWIELLHALKLEPLAMLPFTLAVAAGLTPRAFAYSFFGHSLLHVGSREFVVAVALLAALVVIPLYMRRQWSKRSTAATFPDPS